MLIMTCKPCRDFYRKDWDKRAFTVGFFGPPGSGKTSIIHDVCKVLNEKHNICVVTNDAYTQEDADYLVTKGALPKEKVRSVIVEGCPMAVMNKDIEVNLKEIRSLTEQHHPDIILLESAGDCLASYFSRDLVDYAILVIDIAGGHKLIRKRIEGNNHSELLIINKIDLAEAVGINMEEFKMQVIMTRMDRGLLFTSTKNKKDMKHVAESIMYSWRDHTQQIPPQCP